MNVYIYQADLICEDCGKQISKELTKALKAPEDPEDECSYDSDDFPKGPYPNGGGEADIPNHCGMHRNCVNVTEFDLIKAGCFLENPLTEDGYKYVEKISSIGELGKLWKEFYNV